MLSYAMDGFDLLILGFMLKPISAELGLSAAEAGALVMVPVYSQLTDPTLLLIGGAVMACSSTACWAVMAR